MTDLHDRAGRLVQAMMAALLLTVSLPAVAADPAYLLLSDSPELADAVHGELGDSVVEVPDDIERDSEQELFITEEGEEIKFSTVLHTKSLQDSEVISSLVEEYAPDYIILAWATKKSSSSGLSTSKKEIQIHLRVLDASGKNIHRGSSTTKSKLAITQPSDEDLVLAAVEKYDFPDLKAAIVKNQDRKRKRGQSIKIVYLDIAQTDYFTKRDLLVEMIRKAGEVAKVREKYDKVESKLVLRTKLKGDIEEFYRNLYRSAQDSEGLDKFELDRQGTSFIFTVLAAERQQLMISGLTSQRYNYRKVVYHAAIASQKGVTDVVYKYLDGGADLPGRLAFEFGYNGDLATLEDLVWRSLAIAGEVRNIVKRQLIP